MLDDALLDVEQAVKQLDVAIRVMCYCERGDLDEERFNEDTTILLEQENVSVGSFRSHQDIITASQINVSICFGISAIALDAVFEVAGISPDPRLRNQKSELRSLVYMVRCAFAHNPAYPQWRANGDFARKLSIDLGQDLLSIDMVSLNGSIFDYSHIGGFENWHKIRDMVVCECKGIEAVMK